MHPFVCLVDDGDPRCLLEGSADVEVQQNWAAVRAEGTNCVVWTQCIPVNVVAKAKATIKEGSIRDVNDCMNEDTVLIDIREPAEFQRGHISGAMIIPRGLLEFEIIPALEKRGLGVPITECDIVLYCGTGGRSALAAKSLDAMGFRNVKSMDGGIVAWAEAKLPRETPSA